ncbi:phage tail protein [Nocardioides ginsengisoli]|uniref:Phage tail protein n=1 Tax=Nocardioides ginsengisoli TaxID=363868 RepID=A0ABW3W1S3_9ACTN
MDALALQGRPASLVGPDAWQRCVLTDTSVDGTGALTLAWSVAPAPPSPPGGCTARGLAVDRMCRIHRLVDGVVERLVVGPTDRGLDYARLPEPTLFLGGTPAPVVSRGDFVAATSAPLLDPVGIAIDGQDRMFLADGAARAVIVIDLWGRRVLRRIQLHGVASGLAARGGLVYAALGPAGLVRFSALGEPTDVPLTLPPGAVARRVAVLDDGTPVVLATDAAGESWLVADGRPPLAVGGASDLLVDPDGVVVVAPCAVGPGESALLRRFVPGPADWRPEHPLDATGYDGGGICVTGDGRIGYFTAAGFRLAARVRVTYALRGGCATYRLDSGTPRNRWGRVLIEASVPDGTALSIATATAEEPDAAPLVFHPGNAIEPLHRRPDPVTPWWQGDSCYATFEAPAMAPPGRYLWVTVALTGNERRTPRVHELRVEHTAHHLMRRLPGVFSADPAQADFLQRYLATVDGVLHDLDLRARCRDILLDPHGTPAEALDWLASFLGLVLDDRWAEAARRQLVAEIAPLYRMRGTLGALGRYLQLYLAGERAGDPAAALPMPVILEHFRLRGLSASYAGHAHRFTVLVPMPLSAEAEDVVRHVLDTERPAHTAYDLCTVEAGLRIGHGAHLGLSTMIGPTGAFERAVAGQTVLGRRSILGPPTLPLLGPLTRVG